MAEEYQNVTLGEIGRTMNRMEQSMAELRADLRDRARIFETGIAHNTGAIATLQSTATSHDEKLRDLTKCYDDLDKRVDGIQNKSFFLSGGIATASVIINFFLRNH